MENMHNFSKFKLNIIIKKRKDGGFETIDRLSLSIEDKLLLYCSRLNIEENIRHNIDEIMNKPLNWDYIFDCSIKQGITPLFY
jgi:hypothetical protein